MRLFWKVYISALVCSLAVVLYLAWSSSQKQIQEFLDHAVQEYTTIGRFVGKEIEHQAFESRWPFQSLHRLSQQKEILFWWVVEPDSRIFLAKDPSFAKTFASTYFPILGQMKDVEEKVTILPERHCGIVTIPLTINNNQWSFWIGFSLQAIEGQKRRAF